MSLAINDDGIIATNSILTDIFESLNKLNSDEDFKVLLVVMILGSMQDYRIKYRRRLKKTTNKFTIKSLKEKIAEIDLNLLSLPKKEDMTDKEFIDSIWSKLTEVCDKD